MDCNILSFIAHDAKADSISESYESRFNFFVSRVKRNLHVVLAFYPVGDTFCIRTRRFSGLVNYTSIDQFHAWSRNALVSVAERFIDDIQLSESDIKKSLVNHMAEEHLSWKEEIATDNLINEMQMQPTDAQVQDDAAQIEAKKSTEKSDSAMVIEKNC